MMNIPGIPAGWLGWITLVRDLWLSIRGLLVRGSSPHAALKRRRTLREREGWLRTRTVVVEEFFEPKP